MKHGGAAPKTTGLDKYRFGTDNYGKPCSLAAPLDCQALVSAKHRGSFPKGILHGVTGWVSLSSISERWTNEWWALR